MRIANSEYYNKPEFRGISSFIESKVLINKALIDASADIPMVLKANNKDERRERFNRAALCWSIGFLTPFVTLPVTNRLALKFITKTYKSWMGKENNIIQISNRDLRTVKAMREGLEKLEVKYKFNLDEIVQKAGGDEALRKKLLNAKTAVRMFDYSFTAGLLGSIGFFNNWLTKRKTGRDGFSAEFKMADKSVIDKRAQDYKKREKKMKLSFASLVGFLTLTPLLTRKAILNNSQKGIKGILNKYAHKFDYDNGILMKRLPMFLAIMTAYYGVASASRNNTEMKDNLVRSAAGTGMFFGGDVIMGSVFARLSDKFLKTDIIDKNCEKNMFNKILPPNKHLVDLTGRSRTIGTALFWLNMACLSGLIGFGVPTLLNKMIKRDVEKDSAKSYNNFVEYNTFKDFKISQKVVSGTPSKA